ncbi:Kinesin heavy chain [Varanus komodoensis]|nr:Kinesin heavy chain [Varanus komodoensis]
METGQAELEVQAEAAVGIRQTPGFAKQDSFLVVNEDSDSSIFITKTDEAVHEVCFTRDGVFSLSTGQDKLFLQKLQPLLARVPSGYSLSLLVYEAHRCGPQAETQGLIRKVMEAILQEPPSAPKNALRLQTISFVQIHEDGKARDLLGPKSDTLQVMALPPLGLMVEEATEIVVADPQAATRFYLQGRSLHQSCLQQSPRKRHEAICGSLLTITVETKVDDRGLQRAAVRIFDLFAGGGRPCANPILPLLRAASHRALPAEAGFCSWILRHLLEENALMFLLLCLTLPDASGEEMQTALALTGQVRAMAKRVAQTHWDPAQEIQRRRAAIAELRTRVFFGAQMEQGCLLSSLGRAIKELQVFQAYRAHMEEQADAREQSCRQLLRDSLQDALCLSTQNQQLRAQRQLGCTERATQTDFLAPKQSQKAP